jgi:hypothetical protein
MANSAHPTVESSIETYAGKVKKIIIALSLTPENKEKRNSSVSHCKNRSQNAKIHPAQPSPEKLQSIYISPSEVPIIIYN